MIEFKSSALLKSEWWKHSSILKRQENGTLTPSYINKYLADMAEFIFPKPRERKFLSALTTEWTKIMHHNQIFYAIELKAIGYTELPPETPKSTTRRFRREDSPKCLFLKANASILRGNTEATSICAEAFPEIATLIAKVTFDENPAKTPKTPKTATLTLADLQF